ncbi:hypothetical protein C2S52_021675 [Perilla frutescens var. hirtella]|nr:hypothetical protein C2S52_021675 [Perilla frutescens var. hirtella]KAH6807897.1 hypothetical protein C2S51_029005 [Perilla frutescens var. frutescens]
MATDMSGKEVVVVSNSCWKKRCVETGSIWGNFKNHLHVFIHTPIIDHKDCFKFTWHTMMDKLSTSYPCDSEPTDDNSMELPWDRDLF